MSFSWGAMNCLVGAVACRKDYLSSVSLADSQEAFKGMVVIVSYVFYYDQSAHSTLILIDYIAKQSTNLVVQASAMHSYLS